MNLPPAGPRRSSQVSALAALLLLVAIARPADAFFWPWEDPWPRGSDVPVRRLDHPTVEEWRATHDPARRYRFAAFGDQRALADREWTDILLGIAAEHRQRPVAFALDTGDIVDDGRHTEQFAFLRDILKPIRKLPYLVGLGNHETYNNGDPAARRNTATFLSYLAPRIAPDRFYYRKDLGAATFLFLDTNDFVYGAHGKRDECPAALDPGSRSAEQIRWLRRQADELRAQAPPLTIAVLHHPLVQSSEKHLAASRSLWNLHVGEETLVDLLVDAGVDVVLTGHTHTYERFRLVRDDGAAFDLINLSGRPRDSFLWIGAEERKPRDLRGREGSWFTERGWNGMERWGVVQEELMLEDEANQFALFTVEPAGGLTMELFFLDDDEPGGFRRPGPVRLR